MNWAQHAIERLQKGETATVTPHGQSMRPKVMSGATVTLEPVSDLKTLQKKDIVLCKVNGNVYLHLVKATRGDSVLIGNNRGGTNGWTRTVYGRATHIENP